MKIDGGQNKYGLRMDLDVELFENYYDKDEIVPTNTSNDGEVDDVESEGDGEDADGSDSYSE